MAVLLSRHFPIFENTGCNSVHLHAEGLLVTVQIANALAVYYDRISHCAFNRAFNTADTTEPPLHGDDMAHFQNCVAESDDPGKHIFF